MLQRCVYTVRILRCVCVLTRSQLVTLMTMAPAPECDSPLHDLPYLQDYKSVVAKQEVITALMTLVADPLSHDGPYLAPSVVLVLLFSYPLFCLIVSARVTTTLLLSLFSLCCATCWPCHRRRERIQRFCAISRCVAASCVPLVLVLVMFCVFCFVTVALLTCPNRNARRPAACICIGERFRYDRHVGSRHR